MFKQQTIFIFLFLILLGSTVLAIRSEAYVLFLKHDGENLTAQSIYVAPVGYIEERSTRGEFLAEIYSFEQELLYSRSFDIPREIASFSDPSWFNEQGEQIFFPPPTQKEVTGYKELLLPYFTHGKEIIIKQESQNLLTIPVMQFARTCGDEVCQLHENTLNCEEDCKENTWRIVIIIFGIIAGIALIIFLWWHIVGRWKGKKS